jgi:hypothetical protein
MLSQYVASLTNRLRLTGNLFFVNHGPIPFRENYPVTFSMVVKRVMAHELTASRPIYTQKDASPITNRQLAISQQAT